MFLLVLFWVKKFSLKNKNKKLEIWEVINFIMIKSLGKSAIRNPYFIAMMALFFVEGVRRLGYENVSGRKILIGFDFLSLLVFFLWTFMIYYSLILGTKKLNREEI